MDASREEALNIQIDTSEKIMRKEPQRALILVEAALQRTQSEGHSHAYARALRVRAMCYATMGNMEAAQTDFRVALEYAQNLPDLLLQSQCLSGLGYIHFYRAEFAIALGYLHRSVALRREIGDQHGVMQGLLNLGTYVAEMGDYVHSVAHFTDALQMARQLGDKSSEALTLSNIAQTQLEFGEYERAIEHLTESLRLMHEANSRVYEPIALEKLAHAHYRAGRLVEALHFGQQSIEVCKEIGSQHLEVNSLYVVAKIQTDLGKIDIAEQLLLEALQCAQAAQSRARTAEIYCDLGRLALGKSDFDAAQKYLDEGLVYAQETQKKRSLSDVHLALSDLYVAMSDSTRALEAFRAYHETYRVLQKEIAQNRLAAQLAELELEKAQQQAEIHRLRNIELMELTTRDPLTSLYNRRYLQDYLQHALENPHHRMSLSLAVADLDNFKQVNDRFSHLIGDEVLKVIARLIQNTVRHSDIAVRFGGEEFVIVFPDLLRGGAAEVCERVRRAVDAYHWASIHPDLKMTTSIGIADTVDTAQEIPEIAELRLPAERLLALADQRLYRAKEFGKNQVVWSEIRSKDRV